MDLSEIRSKIREIKDFPSEGILFKDITTLLRDGPAWAAVIDHLAARYHTSRVDIVVGVESRGFIFGAALAYRLKWNDRFVSGGPDGLHKFNYEWLPSTPRDDRSAEPGR